MTSRCKHGVFPHICKLCGGSSDYYDLPPNCISLQDVIEGQDMNWSQANIFKAAYRWDKKPDLEYNLEKIIWFAQDKLERMRGLQEGEKAGRCLSDDVKEEPK